MKKIVFIFAFLGSLLSDSYAQKVLFKETPADSIDGDYHDNIRFADFDADGYLDILSTRKNDGHYDVTITRNNALRFSLVANVIPSSDSVRYEVSDMNNDGMIDVIACRKWQDTLSAILVYLNKGNFQFDEVFRYPVGLMGDPVTADFNNDGMKDIVVNATALSSRFPDTTHALLFRNDGYFHPSVTKIPYLLSGKLQVLDYNNNGRVDLFASGKTLSDSIISKVYLNNYFSFTDTSIRITSLDAPVGAIGNFNKDRYLDIFLSGADSAGKFISEMYLQSDTLLTKLKDFPDLRSTAADMADFDHDGFTDIFISGSNPAGNWVTGIYLNKDSSFIEVFTGLQKSFRSIHAAVADLDNDGNLDIFLSMATDSITNKVLVNVSEKNSAPQPPANLYSISIDSLTFLSWDMPLDDATPGNSLTYDVSVGNLPNTSEFNSAQESFNTVKPLVRKNGAKFNNDVAYFSHLPSRLLYWNVTAIDNSFASHRNSITFGSDSGGTCSGILCPMRALDTTYTKETTLQLVSPSGGKTIWYSTNLGIIGKSTSITYLVSGRDVLYALPVGKDVCQFGYVFNINWNPPIVTDPPVVDPPVVDSPMVNIPDRTVFVPELFSPNQDGVNEFFKVYGKDIQQLSLTIIDRNGSKLYESSDPKTTGWDGKVDGKPQPVGIYFWQVEGKNSIGESLSMNGNTKGVLRLIR
jgi:gliding motility-associated-like protein